MIGTSTPPPFSPTVPALCYLLRGRRGRRGGPAAQIRPLRRIGDGEEGDPLIYGAAPPELKAEKLREMTHVGQKGGRVQRRRAGAPQAEDTSRGA